LICLVASLDEAGSLEFARRFRRVFVEGNYEVRAEGVEILNNSYPLRLFLKGEEAKVSLSMQEQIKAPLLVILEGLSGFWGELTKEGETLPTPPFEGKLLLTLDEDGDSFSVRRISVEEGER